MRWEEILSLTAGRELDALVSEALGVPVLGWDYAMAPDGHWGVFPVLEASEGAERHPIVVDTCVCEAIEGAGISALRSCGHDSACLTVVPFYSTDMSAAWGLVDFLTQWQYVKVRVDSSYWHGDYCSITAPGPTQREERCPVVNDSFAVWGNTAAEAVCRAFLMAVTDAAGKGKVVRSG